MTQYFLGVDIGNTKSHALICNEQGEAVGVGFAGPGNHETFGKDGFFKILSEVIHAAADNAGISVNDITAAGYGLAGYDWAEDLPLMREVIDSLDFTAPYDLMNDAGPGLLAGSSTGWGVSVSAGTSSNARGRDAAGKTARMTGNGMLFDEYGGGVELVFAAVRAISREWSMRGPKTLLSTLFVEHVGAKDVEDFLAGLVRNRYRVGATDAPLVFQAAAEGDAVAQGLVRWLGEGLADLACGIIRQLAIQDSAFEVVLSGSAYKGSPLIQQTMEQIVLKFAPKARFVHITAPPVTGAVMLAMEQVGLDYMPFRERIVETGERILGGHYSDE